MGKSTDRSKNYRNKKDEHSKGGNSRNPRNQKKDGVNTTYYSNDPSWYAADPAILRDAASIPFSWATGTHVELGGTDGKYGYYVPGVCTLKLHPCFSASGTANDPLNIASTAVYSYVRHANAGHTNYDSPDLMLYIIAMSQIYSYIQYLTRIYGLATLYSQRNRYLPRVLVEANGVDFNSIQNNLANFRYGINLLINKAASLACPADMTIFRRHAFLYSAVYSEGTSIKDQMYMYVPASFLKFVEVGQNQSGALHRRSPNDGYKWEGPYTYTDLLNFGNELLDPILQSEDMNIMSGDILKAYGDGNILKLQSLDTSYSIVPVYDEAVLIQMKNAIPVPDEGGSLAVYQNENHSFLISRAVINYSVMADNQDYNDAERETLRKYCYGKVLNSLRGNQFLTVNNEEQATPEMVMEASRLMVSGKADVQWNTSAEFMQGKIELNTGSELCVGFTIWKYTSTGAVHYDYDIMKYFMTKGTSNDILVTKSAKYNELAPLCQFKYHPAICCNQGSMTTVSGNRHFSITQSGPLQMIDNYAVLSADNIAKLHETALLNELHVPSVGKSI